MLVAPEGLVDRDEQRLEAGGPCERMREDEPVELAPGRDRVAELLERVVERRGEQAVVEPPSRVIQQ